MNHDASVRYSSALPGDPVRCLVAAALGLALLEPACGDTEGNSIGSGAESTAGGGNVGPVGGAGDTSIAAAGADNVAISSAGGGSGIAGSETGMNDANLTPNELGYAMIPGSPHPPLLRRVGAVDCDGGEDAPCVSDADCGDGMACVCEYANRPVCVEAECRTDADCESGACLFSRGPDEHCRGSGSQIGLFCQRASTCAEEFGCPGNGQACVYVTEADEFECRIISCSDC